MWVRKLPLLVLLSLLSAGTDAGVIDKIKDTWKDVKNVIKDHIHGPDCHHEHDTNELGVPTTETVLPLSSTTTGAPKIDLRTGGEEVVVIETRRLIDTGYDDCPEGYKLDSQNKCREEI